MSTSDQADENAQQQTLKQLLSAKSDAFEATRYAEQQREERLNSGEVDDFRAEISGTIRPFLFELRAIKRNYDAGDDDGDGESRDHWESEKIASVTRPDGDSVTIRGLEGVLRLDQPVTIKVSKKRAGYGGGEETAQTLYYYPTRVFTNAFYVAVDWMGTVGLLPDPDKTVDPGANPVDPSNQFHE